MIRPAALALAVLASVLPAYGLENPGLAQSHTIHTGGYEFEVDTVSNFHVTNHEFDADEKRLTLLIDSNADENISEIIIPANLIGGNLTFHLDGEQIHPRVSVGEEVSFIVAEFPGRGEHRLDIVGTTYLPEFGTVAILVLAASMIALAACRSKLFVN